MVRILKQKEHRVSTWMIRKNVIMIGLEEHSVRQMNEKYEQGVEIEIRRKQNEYI